MADKIQIRRGNKSALPTLADGEITLVKDEKALYAGIDGKNYLIGRGMPATYICTTQAEFDAAVTAIEASANGGRIILGEGTYTGKDITKPTIIEGIGDATDITFLSTSPTYTRKLNVNIKNAKVHLGFCSGTAVFENCSICETDKWAMFDGGTVRVMGGSITMTGSAYPEYSDCQTAFVRGDVYISNCKIKLSNNQDEATGFELNLTYGTNGCISNCNIVCDGRGRTNIIGRDIYGDKMTMLCNTIRLDGGMYNSICHYTTDKNDSLAAFCGNSVSYLDTYLAADTVSGNTFNRTKSSVDGIILECPTCMTGNRFVGQAATIKGSSMKHIITNNLYDAGLSINYTAAGSITTGNLQK